MTKTMNTETRINWPHVALVAIAIGGLLGALAIVLTMTPPGLLEKLLELNWPAVIVGFVSLCLTVYAMLIRAGVVHGDKAATAPAAPPELDDDEDPLPRTDDTTQRVKREKRRGAASPSAVTLVVLGAIIVALAALMGGCGPGAVRQHVTAATIATIALAGASDAIEGATGAALAACPAPGQPGREDCIADVELTAERVGAAFDTVLPIVASYREAVQVAALAGDSEQLLASLMVAATRLLRAWGPLLAEAHLLGLELPALAIGGAP